MNYSTKADGIKYNVVEIGLAQTIHFFVFFFKGKHVEQLTVILGNRSPAAGYKKTETT